MKLKKLILEDNGGSELEMWYNPESGLFSIWVYDFDGSAFVNLKPDQMKQIKDYLNNIKD